MTALTRRNVLSAAAAAGAATFMPLTPSAQAAAPISGPFSTTGEASSFNRVQNLPRSASSFA